MAWFDGCGDAFVTVTNAADGLGKRLEIQQARLDKGTGEFALFLLMYCNGSPAREFLSAAMGTAKQEAECFN